MNPTDRHASANLSYLAPDAPWAPDFPLRPAPTLVGEHAPACDLSLPRRDDAFTAPGEELLGLFRANVDALADFARITQGLPTPPAQPPIQPPAPLKPLGRSWWELVIHAVPSRKPRRRLAAPAGRHTGT